MERSITEKKRDLIILIVEKLSENNLLGFLIQEVEDSLNYMSYYQVRNVYDNLSKLIKTLKNIQETYLQALAI